MHRLAICDLKSASSYSQSKPIQPPDDKKRATETHAEHEDRVWRQRCHRSESGKVFIPPTQFANSLKDAAAFDPQKIPGAGNQTYTKHFDAGIMCIDDLELNVLVEDVLVDRQFVPSDGKRGGGKRVWKNFPLILSWSGVITFHVLDDTIHQEVFARTLETAGGLIGIGRFRPRNRGYYGRFIPRSIEWQEVGEV